MGSVLARITATAVNILYSSGWGSSEYIGYSCGHILYSIRQGCNEYISYSCKYIVVVRAVSSILATNVNV